MKRLLPFCIAFLCFGFGVAHAATFKIAVLSFQSKEDTLKKWGYLENYLNKSVQYSAKFIVVPMFYDELDSAVANASVDFVLTNTGHYVVLEHGYGLSAIASLEKKSASKWLDSFGGVIFTRSDRADIRDLKDLKDASFIAVKAESLGGYMAAAGEFQKNGRKPEKYFRQLLFTGMPHQRVVEAVLAGKADAGTVRTGVLESLISKGEIKRSDFKVLHERKTPSFPFVRSTALYPEWPMSVMPHVDEKLANAVALALISGSLGKQSLYRWKVSKNYEPVRQLMMHLRVKPYDKHESVWYQIKKYQHTLLAICFVLFMLGYFSISLYRSNRKLLISQARSKHTAEVLERIASSKPCGETLKTIVLMVEDDFPSIRSSILLLKNKKLYKGAAPSLPEAYNSALEGVEIGPSVGSCGTAAYRGERVVVENIDTDPLWAPYKGLALQYDLKSCWSEPILDASGKVLGTFAMYSEHPSRPSSYQLEEISSAAYLAGIAIERERNESRLRKLAQTVEQTGEGVLITNQNGEIEFVNKAFTTTTGYTFDEVVGKNPNILSSGRQDKEFYEKLWQDLEQHGTWAGMLWNRRKNGEEYPERLHITVIEHDVGEPHYIGIFSDITEQLSIEEQLRHGQKMEAIGTLVAGIAHDFNNILAGMLGNAYLLRKKLEHQTTLLAKVKNIEELGFRAGDLITQMLAFAHKGVLEKSNFNIEICMAKAIKLAKVALPKEILFNETLSHDKLMVFADNTLLQQVMINIINNARDAVEHVLEPQITVLLQRQHADSAFKGTHEKAHADEYAKLTILDNGSGISEEVMAHIFDPFYTTKAINKGTGLGLSMALGTIQSHEGFIDVDSELGKGTAFHIYLPLLEETHDEVKKVAMPEPVAKENIHILVADDEPHILEMLVEILQEDGYSIYAAKDGKEALSVYQNHESFINLAILDMSMPKMSGVQVAKAIKALAPNLPIIFNSGYDKTEMPHEVYNCKSCFKLQKPVEISVLKQTIHEALEMDAQN